MRYAQLVSKLSELLDHLRQHPAQLLSNMSKMLLRSRGITC